MSLELDAVTLRGPDGRALFAPLGLAVAPGTVACVMGPSGIGKSTLLAAIGGHLAPGFTVTGTIRLAGETLRDQPPEARRIGLMFQDPALFPHLSVADNLGFGLPRRHRGRAERARRVAEALAAAGLEGLGPRDPATLSGGQKARAALMRTLLAEPRALLLDEPFAGLDADRRDEMRRFVAAHVAARGIPALLVTHDAADAAIAAGAPVLLHPA